MYACWEGKSFLLTIEDFTSYAYKEAAEALLTKQAAEGYPPGLFLQHIELELSKIRVEATPQAVAAANALILKKVEGAAIKLQGCFTGYCNQLQAVPVTGFMPVTGTSQMPVTGSSRTGS